MTRELQKERQQRGEDFQAEMRRSWRKVPNVWRLRLKDGKGSSQPADELVLLHTARILGEHKRTESDRFEMNYLRPNQVKGLADFVKTSPYNVAMVFVSFLNEKEGVDLAFAVEFKNAVKFMQKHKRKYILMTEFQTDTELAAIELPRLPGLTDRLYDLGGLNECYKFS